jgi:hypothetical protein
VPRIAVPDDALGIATKATLGRVVRA